jgi:hypothetical protein
VTLGAWFDFAVALPDPAGIETNLVAIIRRQIASAERIIDLTRSSRANSDGTSKTLRSTGNLRG